jgi:hypothetical protein
MRRALCTAFLMLGCGAESAPSASSAGAAAVAAPPAAFSVYGLPGPWWRAGAAQEDFERESRECRRQSSEARAQPGGLGPSDAAYRAFLDCMLGHGWNRGTPPEAAATPG